MKKSKPLEGEPAMKKLLFREKRFVKLYVQRLLKGKITPEDIQELINVYDSSEQRPELKYKHLIKRRRIQQMTLEEIEKLYDSKGINAKLIIEQEKKILEGATEKQDYSSALKVVNNWRDSLGMNNKQIQVQSSSFSLEATQQSLLNDIEEKKRLKAESESINTKEGVDE